MHGAIVSPSLGIYATSVGKPSGFQSRRTIRDRQGVRSAPANFRHRRRPAAHNQNAFGNHSFNSRLNRISTAFGPRSSPNGSSHDDQMRLKVDDVICLAEQTRETASQENRRSVLEEAQKTIRHEVILLNSSRPHSVIGMGLQALTSPMPLSTKDKNTRMQMDHIPTLLPLPSDRAFIPSPDRDNPRHVNTPVDDIDGERPQSVARQCCEIMGRSMCNSCRKLERRLLNRQRAERECPRMRISQQNITTTQVVKRFYPHLTDSEIQDKIARGEIAKSKFLSRMYPSDGESDSDGDDSCKEDEHDQEVSTPNHLAPVGHVFITKKQKRQKHENGVIYSDNPIFALTQLKMKLKGLTSTPLFFTDLKGVQAKILSGEVDRKRHLIKPPSEHVRLNSAMSTLSTTSSNKSTLSKKGLKLSESLMPVFVSPRKVKIHQEPSYKVFYEPPLLSKRRQIPNPSFFAGSSEAYSLPERLPDIIEFADSKIKALEKQGRSTSSMSFASNMSEEAFEYERSDPLSSSRKEVEKSERDGEVMLGDSLSSSTPRMWLKSTNDVIDENLTGEEEHAKEVNDMVVEVTKNSGEIHGGQTVEKSEVQNIEDNEGEVYEGQNIEDDDGEVHGSQNIEDDQGEVHGGQNMEDNEGEVYGGQKVADDEGKVHGGQNIEDDTENVHGGQNIEDDQGGVYGGQNIEDKEREICGGQNIEDNELGVLGDRNIGDDEGETHRSPNIEDRKGRVYGCHNTEGNGEEMHGGQIIEENETTSDRERSTEQGDISGTPQSPQSPQTPIASDRKYQDMHEGDTDYDYENCKSSTNEDASSPPPAKRESQLQQEQEEFDKDENEDHDEDNLLLDTSSQVGSLVSENDKEMTESDDES